MWPADINPKLPSAITVRGTLRAFKNAMFVHYGTALRLSERKSSVSSRLFYLSMHLPLPLPDELVPACPQTASKIHHDRGELDSRPGYRLDLVSRLALSLSL